METDNNGKATWKDKIKRVLPYLEEPFDTRDITDALYRQGIVPLPTCNEDYESVHRSVAGAVGNMHPSSKRSNGVLKVDHREDGSPYGKCYFKVSEDANLPKNFKVGGQDQKNIEPKPETEPKPNPKQEADSDSVKPEPEKQPPAKGNLPTVYIERQTNLWVVMILLQVATLVAILLVNLLK